MTIGAVLLDITHTLPPLTFLLPTQKGLEIFGKQSVLTLHLAKFELPTRAACGLQFVEDIFF